MTGGDGRIFLKYIFRMQNILAMKQKKAKIAVHETSNMDAARNEHKILFEQPEQISHLGIVTVKQRIILIAILKKYRGCELHLFGSK
jgi:hypothetical protein